MPRHRVGSYQKALHWIADNDLCVWAFYDEPSLPATASMICDIFGRFEYEVINDLKKVLANKREV